jgi:membrane-bound inhibitor of C-type lysozyme
MTRGHRFACGAIGMSLLASVAGCASKPEDEPKTAYYRCGDTARFGVKPLKNDRIELSRSPNRYTLNKVDAPSGAKYASSKASFWNQGDTAVIEVGDKRFEGCKFDHVQADPQSIGTLQQLLMQGTTGGGKR